LVPERFTRLVSQLGFAPAVCRVTSAGSSSEFSGVIGPFA